MHRPCLPDMNFSTVHIEKYTAVMCHVLTYVNMTFQSELHMYLYIHVPDTCDAA